MTEKKSHRNTPLKKIESVRAEMARVYWGCRNKTLQVSDGSKLIYMLKAIGETIRDTELESRIEALEREVKK